VPVVLLLNLGVVDELLVSHPKTQDRDLGCGGVAAKFDACAHTVILYGVSLYLQRGYNNLSGR